MYFLHGKSNLINSNLKGQPRNLNRDKNEEQNTQKMGWIQDSSYNGGEKKKF